MRTLFGYFNQHQLSFAVVITLAAVLGTVAKKAIEALLEYFSAILMPSLTLGSARGTSRTERPAPGGERSERGSKTRDSAPSSHSIARWHVGVRLRDAKAARAQEESSAKLSRILSGALTFAQVVIGGVLASSFVQEALPPKTVGVFGVLVLIASLVKQQYRPEVDAEQARQKASKLQALIRLAEDQLTTLDGLSSKGEDRTDALIDLRNQISRGLTEIENPESSLSKISEDKLLPKSTS
jgi:hypothetical protein